MPAYNAERYLGTAVASVLRQSFSDLELLIVDDGSSDRTVEMARGFANATRGCAFCSRPNAGPGPARNAGFRAATGRLFAFLDSDDEWDETFLAEQMAILDARPDDRRGDRQRTQSRRPARRPAGAAGRGDGPPITLATILADETALFIMAVFRARWSTPSAGSIRRCSRTRNTRCGSARRSPGSRSPGTQAARLVRVPARTACRRRQADAVRHSACLREDAAGAAGGSPELAILDQQVARFEMELRAAEAREACARRCPRGRPPPDGAPRAPRRLVLLRRRRFARPAGAGRRPRITASRRGGRMRTKPRAGRHDVRPDTAVRAGARRPRSHRHAAGIPSASVLDDVRNRCILRCWRRSRRR